MLVSFTAEYKQDVTTNDTLKACNNSKWNGFFFLLTWIVF